MYHNMWTNAPKETDEFPDYTCDQHFGKPVPSYLEREQFRGYIIGRAAKSDVRRFIQFNTVVRHVEFHVRDERGDKFSVKVEDLISKKSRTEWFDYVVVASGHFSVPEMPLFDGLDQFPGRIIHSHDFRNGEEFVGQNVLVIGSRWSAEDIALQLYKFGAKSITISYRNKPIGFSWPEAIVEVPLLTEIKGKTVHFKDGIKRDIDSIIFCTGYQHHFPFLAENLRLVTGNRPYPGQLYKGIFFQDQPNLLYLGMQDVTFPVHFDAQAWYARDVILGRTALPDPEERQRDIASWQEREAQEICRQLIDVLRFMADYIKDLLLAVPDFPPIDLDGIVDLSADYIQHKEEDILSYRDKRFTSLQTGTQAAPNDVPWIRAGRIE